MKRLVWLASYPKSGNTWMRMLFAAYQTPHGRAFRLPDAFSVTRNESRRSEYEHIAGRTGLSVQEIDELREAVQRSISQTIRPPILLKTHNARVMHNGFSLIRREFTLGAIYVVRNPLDVVDSVADHWGVTADQAIAMMNNRRQTIGGPSDELVTQYLETWSNHVRSWVFQSVFPVHVVRYEDILCNTELTFRNVLTFLGWPLKQERIARAIEETRFDKLSGQELQARFDECSKQSLSGRFFRKGRAGGWANVLSKTQVEQVMSDHGDVMRRLGYGTHASGVYDGCEVERAQ